MKKNWEKLGKKFKKNKKRIWRKRKSLVEFLEDFATLADKKQNNIDVNAKIQCGDNRKGISLRGKTSG
jgi:hypothetical protein